MSRERSRPAATPSGAPGEHCDADQPTGPVLAGVVALVSSAGLAVAGVVVSGQPVADVSAPGLAGVDLRQLAAFTSAARLQDRALSAVDAAARGTLLAVSVLGGDRVDARDALLSLADLLTGALLDACDDELSGMLGDRL